MDPTNNILSDIRERMVRVETKIDTFTDADKIIFWAGTTIVGTLVIALIALLISNGGN